MSKIHFQSIALVAVLAFPALRHPSVLAASKLVRVRAVEPTDDFKLIVFGRVFEEDNGILFPVTTLDREAFSLALGKDMKIDVKPDSLSTYSSLAQPRARRMVITFPFAANVPESTMRDIRQTLAENLPLTRSDYLSVLSITSEGESEIAGATPGVADNIRALQKRILDAKSAGKAVGTHNLVCAAGRKFSEWARYAAAPGEQQVLVLITHPSEARTDDLRTLTTCLDELTISGVAIYLLKVDAIPHLPVNAEKLFDAAKLSGGYVQRVGSRVDLFPALSNLFANLNEEYVATFNLFSLVGNWDGRRAIAQDGVTYMDLGVTYHGQSIKSGVFTVPLQQGWRDNIERINQAKSENEHFLRMFLDLNYRERVIAGVLAAILVVTVLFIFRYWLLSVRLWLRSVRCRTCGLRVKRSFSNCPYRETRFAGWLSVLNGKDIGMVLPVMQGANLIGTSDSCQIHFRRGYKIRRKHAELLIDNGKAQFKTLRPGVAKRLVDMVNGFPVHEARLLAHGDVLRIGEAYLRFELREADQTRALAAGE